MNFENKSVEEIIELLLENVNEQPNALQGNDASFSFTIDDGEKKDYTLIIRDGRATVEPSVLPDANCHISISGKNFKKLISGNLNATTAFMTGKLKIKGNIADALKLESMLKKLSF